MSLPDVEVSAGRRLGNGLLAQLHELVREASVADGVGPLSEHARLHVERGGGLDLVALAEDGSVAGFAHVDPAADPAEPATAELVVAPAAREHGYGAALVRAVQEQVGAGGVRFWAHGQRPGALALADALGWVQVRELWQMRRPLTGPEAMELADPPDRPDVRIRSFRPGRDETAWLTVNARAFAHHPEQGAWTATDLAEREEAPWFDPDGFLLAEVEDRLAGYHWTKQHGSVDGRALGEIYVLGVDPDFQGHGLGGLLTSAGLHHLQARGIDDVMLYVEGDNTAAIATYRRFGFERYALDVMYALPAALDD